MNLIWIVCLFIGASCSDGRNAAQQSEDWQAAIEPRSGEVFAVSNTIVLPKAHPASDRKMLQPAMYCETCRRWYPVPPMDELQRTPQAGSCPKDQTPLTITGPKPAQALPVESGISP